MSLGELEPDLVEVLTRVQNDLFDVGADFCTPIVDDPKFPPLRVLPAYVDRLEGWCDQYNEPLEKLRSFILPGGTKSAALLHVARTVARRAERSAWAAYEVHADTMNPTAITYLNRLSDLLFIVARFANRDPEMCSGVPAVKTRAAANGRRSVDSIQQSKGVER